MPESSGPPCDRHDQRISDHSSRIQMLETNAKVAESQLTLLSVGSHEKSNWLNRHNLEISEIKMKANNAENLAAVLTGKYDGLDNELTALNLQITQQLAQLRSDIRQNSWAVALIVSIIVAGGRAVMDKLF